MSPFVSSNNINICIGRYDRCDDKDEKYKKMARTFFDIEKCFFV